MVVSTSRQQPISERLRTVQGTAVLSKRSLADLSMDALAVCDPVRPQFAFKLLEMSYGCDEHHIFLLADVQFCARPAIEAAG